MHLSAPSCLVVVLWNLVLKAKAVNFKRVEGLTSLPPPSLPFTKEMFASNVLEEK